MSIRRLLPSILFLFPVACRSGEPVLLDAVPAWQAQDAGSNAAYWSGEVVRRLAGQLPQPSPAMVARLADPREGCVVQVKNGFLVPTVDVDLNGVPDDAWVRIECLITDSLTYPDSITYTHTIDEARFVQTWGAPYAYTFTSTSSYATGDRLGHREEFRWAVTEVVDVRSTRAEMRLSFLSTGGGEVRSEFHALLDPDGTIVPGQGLPDGSLRVEGSLDRHEPGIDWRFTVETVEPLTFTAACLGSGLPHPFHGGSLRGLLDGSGSATRFTTTYSSCGTAPFIGVEGGAE